MPLAEAGVKYAADVSRSIVAQVSDALRTPLLGTETITVRATKRGSKTTTTKAAIPAWAAVAAGVIAVWWFSPHGGGGGGGGGDGPRAPVFGDPYAPLNPLFWTNLFTGWPSQ